MLRLIMLVIEITETDDRCWWWYSDVTDDTDMICHDLHIGSHHIVRYDMS